MPTTRPAIIATALGFTLTSFRATGLVTNLPVVVRPPPAKASGVWTVTVAVSRGIWIGFLHFGQGPDLPANFSLT